jgi:cell fate regulator YaaT (PSP1 superfamily)
MKLVKVRYFSNEKKGIFYYTADGRVDFRQLVKDLAKEFRMRIEMRQIGVRDEAKMLGGMGVCGRHLCCASFMTSFEPVTIQKAKKQKIAINPTKISGLCGRLMCCLAFEDESRGRLYSEEEKAVENE